MRCPFVVAFGDGRIYHGHSTQSIWAGRNPGTNFGEGRGSFVDVKEDVLAEEANCKGEAAYSATDYRDGEGVFI